MKITIIGDTHGRSKWKNIVEKEKDADKIIFIGDYFDAKDGGYSANRQIENFKEIVEFKRNNPDKVILLIGNHDFHYLKGVNEEYSG
jgi:predicted phosphodiesterase